MADLIIKPSSGTGNKLILQDQAGNAILTTGDTAAAAKFGFGAIQIKHWRKKSAIHDTSGASEFTMAAPFDGTATITPGYAGNFIKASFGMSGDHGTTWRSGQARLDYSTDGGSNWKGICGGATNAFNTSDAMFGNMVHLEGIFNPNTTSAVKVRIRWKNHTSGHFTRYGQYNNPAQDNTSVGPWYESPTGSNYPAVGSWLFLEEYGAGMCTTADTA